MNNVEQDYKGRLLESDNQQTFIQPRGSMTLEQARASLDELGITASFRTWFNGWNWVWVAQGRCRGHRLQALGMSVAEAHDRLIYYAAKAEKFGGSNDA